MNTKKKRNKLVTRILVLVTVLALGVSAFLSGAGTEVVADSVITMLDKNINTQIEKYLDGNVVYQLPDTISDDQTISLIVQTQQAPLLDVYNDADPGVSITEYAASDDAAQIRSSIAEEKADLLKALDKAGISYSTGADYSVIISGFELVVTAGDFESICKTLGDDVTVYISEAYEACDAEVVTNEVDVYDTGIIDSSDFAYDGTGIVVAVLDTGIDYTHTAFSLNNFTSDKLGLTYDDVAAVLSDTVASTLVEGLTAADVYLNEKIPYMFDYADNDSDAYPLNNEHGTHVSGIIAGKDDTITGVAPNAQLVEMKIFSDVYDSAIASWILNALEDCVVLGVDVINMSIGTACGFARESDEELLTGVYEKILNQGISLIVAASNSYNSSFGSEKNGNLPLTSNPDSATVGSPSTYDSAMSVASVSGVPTPYLVHDGEVIYFTESVDRVSEERDFVSELLGEDTESIEIEYILVPGAGRSADYTGLDVNGKIVLVARGSTTFEEKAAVAEANGAAGLIIYNNVSGDIKMNVGDATIPVCSISQDDGEVLAEAGSGTLTISVDQAAGPFINDYSSWGPTPSLQIKPEITAHGGSILSAVNGQEYDRLSGTSMATPNVSGLCALLREYVKENFPNIADDNVAVTTLVNQLMMSTADILLNTNGNPYSVRKQGAGNANLNSCAATSAYIQTYNADGSKMTKTKLELGDDPEKLGVYTMNFSVVNFGDTELTYDLSAYVMTEGVSETLTSHGDTTVTEEAYILEGATVEFSTGDKVTVPANSTTDITVTITLSDEDKAYLDTSFENGMYVEGYIVLTNADEEGVSLNIPYLAFYGDWTVAPIFDLTYFDTNADELDLSLDAQDKTMADAYATRPIGGIYSDYVSYLGSYYFQQDPSVNQIAADEDHIALSNQDDAINSLRFIWAGMLRNAAEIQLTITDDATGEVVFERLETDIRKSYGDGGSIYPANIDVEFSAIEHELKNNTQYTVTLTGKLDYGDGGVDTNKNNTITFPLYVDFEAPSVTDCEFYTEYDSSTKQTRYYCRLYVYDNHYSMGAQVGYVYYNDTDAGYVLEAFDQYLTPIYSDFNTTTEVVYELTDYIDQIRTNSSTRNSITLAVYDYALNYATYEIGLPDDFLDIAFAEEEIVISPYQVVDLSALVYPESEWSSLLEYYCTSPAGGEVARVVNDKLIGVAEGSCVVIARDPETKKQATVKVTILGEEDEGYVRYDKPVLETFEITGYTTNKAFYFLSTEDQEIGLTGDTRKFTGADLSLSLYPSESVTLDYVLSAYFPETTDIVYTSSNENIVTVDENGTITAVAEGFGSINVQVTMDEKNTYYSKSITITVKDPYITSGATLTNYFGLGGTVSIPDSLKLTAIGDYAFANSTYVEKTEDDYNYDENANTKIFYIGEDTVTTVIIPEGVESIGEYAFANMTNLTTVVLPSTLTKIDQGAFYGCPKLTTITGLENVKFINQYAFADCDLTGSISLDSCVAIANNAFANNENLESVKLSAATQSVGANAFNGCSSLTELIIEADSVKLGEYVFANCTSLEEVTLNTAVVTRGAFFGCSELKTVNLGAGVSVIAEYAFGKTALETVNFDASNTNFKVSADGTYITNAAGTELLLVLPSINGSFTLEDANITTIANGAFAGCSKLTEVNMPYVTSVGPYAFADCGRLRSVTLGKLTAIGDYAFYGTSITEVPDLTDVTEIGAYAFAETKITEVSIPDGVTIGKFAFYNCTRLESVTIGNDVTIGEAAFSMDNNSNWTYDYYIENDTRYYYYIYTSPLHSLTIGDNASIGNYAFSGAAELESVTLGAGATIGEYAFYNASKLTSIDLSKVISIGNYAFSGDILMIGTDNSFALQAVGSDGYYMYSYHATPMTSIDLSSAESVGDYAFAYCRELADVKLGASLTTLPEGTFYGCVSLENVNLESVTTLGDYAFAESGLKKVDLSAVEAIGEYAFLSNLSLESVTLNPNGCTVGKGAFIYDEKLSELSGEEAATSIGDYAFSYTAITEADLTAAQYIGAHAFYKEELTEFTVTLGTALTELGDNPFAMCILEPFRQEKVTVFNTVDYFSYIYSYTISDTVQVINGSLYQTVPSGLELVTYAGTDEDVTVADNTVRISAMAFAGADMETVTLPHTVAALGHKAFYQCDNLAIVTFCSYNAPVLEEEYDYAYFLSFENISGSGEYTFYDTDGVTPIAKPGLGVTPYFLWNAAENPSTVFYGASFVDYIGRYDADLVMVRPVNGKNYETFIMDQYFVTAINGAAAADEVTQSVIDMINALPETVSLGDKANVEAARAAYELISTTEQKALVTNYSKLTAAEKRISDLEYLESEQASSEPTEAPTNNDGGSIGWIIGAVVAVLAAAAAVILVKKNHKKAEPAEETEEAEDAEPEEEEEISESQESGEEE